MRRRVMAGSSGSFEAINVTPLIDVVMCLIIFFLIVTKLANDQGATLRLPQAGMGEKEETKGEVVVSVRPLEPGEASEGTWKLPVRVAVGGTVVAGEQELEEQIRERTLDAAQGKRADVASVPVLVRADRVLPFGAVEPVLRVCRRAGLLSVRLATEHLP